MNKLKEDIYNIRFAIILIIIYVLLTEIIFGKICPINILFNVDCPGCGLTRAAIALFTLNIKKSLEFNSTCILWLITILLFIIDRYIKKLSIKPFPYLFIIVSIITIIWYLFFKVKLISF